jgi:hypothetical protein
MNMVKTENDMQDFDDSDEKWSPPYPKDALTRMSDKQLKAERLKQISLADQAQDADDDVAEDLASRKLTSVLIEIDKRGLKVSYK